MMTFGALREARPEQWHELSREVDRWRERLIDDALRLRNEIANPLLDGANNRIWNGHAQQGAALRLDDVVRTFDRAADDLLPTIDGCRVFGDRLAESQRLALEVAQRALERGWTVRDDGAVEIPAGWPVPPGSSIEQETELARGIRDDIARHVDAASAEDDVLSGVLAALSDIVLDPATEGAADRAAEQAAHRAVDLVAVPEHERTAEQVRELAGLIERHGDDPTFATRFYDDLGPQGYLDLAASLRGPGAVAPDGMSPVEMNGLRDRAFTQLGETLALATDPSRSGDDAGARTAGLLDALDRDHGDGDYQALGGLLGHGRYAPEFLDPVTDRILAEDQRQPFAEVGIAPERGTYGGDPVVGLLTALENSPEGAAVALDPRGGPAVPGGPSHIEYLLEHRQWGSAGPGSLGIDPHGPDGGYDRLGRALEAATIGGQRTAESAAVFSETIRVLGDDDLPGTRGTDISPALRDDLGRMMAGYIEDVNLAYSRGDLRGGDDFTFPYDGVHYADVGTFEVARVLDEIARDPNGWADVHDAQTVFASQWMADTLVLDGRDSETVTLDFENSVSKSAGVLGMINEARAHAIQTDFADQADQYNAQIKGAGVVIGTSAAMLGGPPGAAAGSLITLAVEQMRMDNTGLGSAGYADSHEGTAEHVGRLAEQAMLNADNGPGYPGLKEGVAPPTDLPRDMYGRLDMSQFSAADRENYGNWHDRALVQNELVPPFSTDARSLARSELDVGIGTQMRANGRFGAGPGS